MLEIKEEIFRSKYFSKIEEDFYKAATSIPDFLEKKSEDTKKQQEAYIHRNYQSCKKKVERIRRWKKQNTIRENRAFLSGFEQIKINRQKQKLQREFDRILAEEEMIGIHHAMTKETVDSFKEQLFDMIERARNAAPQLATEALMQAIRNYMVYAVFCVFCGVEVRCKSSIFGYSMLYPVTDNYIDNEAVTEHEKQRYNQFILDTILLADPKVTNENDVLTGRMLNCILEEYKQKSITTESEQITTLLILMLKAESESLKQQSQIKLTEKECFDISIFKGGISVFIDRFLVEQELTVEETEFFLAFGFMLQLADDLQDILEDRSLGYQTLFTKTTSKQEAEELVNRLMWFTKKQFSKITFGDENMKRFLLQSLCYLYITSAASVADAFSESYLKQLEEYLPVHLEELVQMKGLVTGTFSKDREQELTEFLDEMLASDWM